MIQAESIWVNAGGRWVLQGLTLHAQRGEVTAVTGHNGSGKTVLGRALAGILPLSGGRVTIDGIDIRRHKARRMTGYLPQQSGLYDYLNVTQNLRFFAAVAGVPWLQRRKVCADLLELVGLTRLGADEASRLTPGQRQRLALACAMVGDPAALILDEPLNGLDGDGRADMRHLLQEMAGMGKAVLVIAGDLDGLPVVRRWFLSDGVLKGGEVA